jgi:hypothetical protein
MLLPVCVGLMILIISAEVLADPVCQSFPRRRPTCTRSSRRSGGYRRLLKRPVGR